MTKNDFDTAASLLQYDINLLERHRDYVLNLQNLKGVIILQVEGYEIMKLRDEFLIHPTNKLVDLYIDAINKKLEDMENKFSLL